MKRAIFAAAAAALMTVSGLGTAIADEHEGRKFSPVETFTCNFRDGRSSADLDKVIAKWNQWMDDRDSNDYFAATVTPIYHGAETFDIGWLGSWPTGAAMGAGMDQWMAEGGEVGAEFFAILDCDTHSNFASTMLKAPPRETPPDNILMTFQDCNVNEGSSWDDVMAGLEGWAAHQTERGYENGLWMMFAAYGGGDAEFDFKLVEGWDTFTSLGEAYDMYGTGGDWAKYGELVGGLLECDEARVYDGSVVRRMETE